MFHGFRWADAFVAVLGKDAAEGFACLKAMVPPVKAIPGELYGYYTARRLEKLLHSGAAAAGFSGAGAVNAIRFIALLVEKNRFKYIDVILPEIEQLLDKQNGVLAVTVESTAPLDSAFEQTLKQRLAERYGAASIKLKTRIAPELLGGYRLRIGGLYIDASLRGQTDSIKADLEAAALKHSSASAPGGGT
ncbi:MAG: ATP synthase F1 subunit delta [Treponema sp.]|nr:ATP synthase F1 subunit delta [Treponema sp.]